LEPSVIIHLLLNCRGLLGRDAFAEFFAVEKALQNEVGAALAYLAGRRFKKLLAEGTAA
jgi:hypothetical protein